MIQKLWVEVREVEKKYRDRTRQGEWLTVFIPSKLPLAENLDENMKIMTYKFGALIISSLYSSPIDHLYR